MEKNKTEILDTITQVVTLKNGKEKCISIDRETGEVVAETWKVFRSSLGGKQPQKNSQPAFIKVWLPNLIQTVQQKNLSNVEAGILFKLMAFLDWQGTMLVHPETGRTVNTNDIAKYLRLDAEYLSRQLDALVQKGLLGKFISGNGKPYRYHFNCNLAHFGKRMNDMRDLERFNRDCSYEPRVRVEYKKEELRSRSIRRDF